MSLVLAAVLAAGCDGRTVVATVLAKRGGYEMTLPQTAEMLVDRIRQAQAGQTPDAGAYPASEPVIDYR